MRFSWTPTARMSPPGFGTRTPCGQGIVGWSCLLSEQQKHLLTSHGCSCRTQLQVKCQLQRISGAQGVEHCPSSPLPRQLQQPAGSALQMLGGLHNLSATRLPA